MCVFINIRKFKYWKENLTYYHPKLVEEIEQIIWKAKNLIYLKEKFQYELVVNITDDRKKILKQVHQQLLKVMLC